MLAAEQLRSSTVKRSEAALIAMWHEWFHPESWSVRCYNFLSASMMVLLPYLVLFAPIAVHFQESPHDIDARCPVHATERRTSSHIPRHTKCRLSGARRTPLHLNWQSPHLDAWCNARSQYDCASASSQAWSPCHTPTLSRILTPMTISVFKYTHKMLSPPVHDAKVRVQLSFQLCLSFFIRRPLSSSLQPNFSSRVPSVLCTACLLVS